jgi:metal-responsive CopG/Arc/MetJ family transcriptional regulator
MERMTISVPAEMARRIEARRKAEKRTRSGLIQEAFRRYDVAAQIPAKIDGEDATPAELRALARGRAASDRGESVSLKEALRQIDASASGSLWPRWKRIPSGVT